MARTRRHNPLRVLLNSRLVGHLFKDTSGAIEFRYAPSWLGAAHAIPVSLSIPLREDPYKGEALTAVFENLLPDSDVLRRRAAEKVGASGTDAYSLLSEIGRDCLGALQFLPDDAPTEPSSSSIEGKVLGDDEIEAVLKNLTQAPRGLSPTTISGFRARAHRKRPQYFSMRGNG